MVCEVVLPAFLVSVDCVTANTHRDKREGREVRDSDNAKDRDNATKHDGKVARLGATDKRPLRATVRHPTFLSE
jgi:hypothetical protein